LVQFVGREEEVAILARRWELAKQSKGQVVVLSGEPGIGKSRLVQVLRNQITGDSHAHRSYQCSPFQSGRPFHPIIAQIEHAANFTAQGSLEQKTEQLRALTERMAGSAVDDFVVYAALLSLPGGERLSDIEPDPERRKARILATYLRQIEGLAAERTLLCVFEDVHWSDPSTMNVLQRLVEWIPSYPVLLLLTCRPEFVSPWMGFSHSSFMVLSRMPTNETSELAACVAGGRLPGEVVAHIVSKTDGIPLFVEELTRTVIESCVVEIVDGAYRLAGKLPTLAIPATLHDSLMARLDRLSGARDLAQLGATIGRSFEYRLLSAVANRADNALTGALAQLEDAGLLFRRGSPPDASYSFKHALIQEAAYGSLLRATRQEYHRRIAAAMERQRTGFGKTDAALLAHHYAEGGMIELAIQNLRVAGEAAVRTSANSEAIDNYSKALELLQALPEGQERSREEISLRLALGGAQVQVGAASIETEQNYLRAKGLCDQGGTLRDRFAALWGLWYHRFIQGDAHRMREYGDQLLPLAEEMDDTDLILEAHHVQWAGLTMIGDLRKALAHAEEGLARYDQKLHQRLTFIYGGHDPGACAHNLSAIQLCILGYPEQAQRRVQAGIALACELGHNSTLLEGCFSALVVGLLLHDGASVEQHASIVQELVQADKLPKAASCLVDGFHGGILSEQGSVEQGLSLMHRSREGWQSFWGAWCFPLDASMAAALCKCGRVDEGLQIVERTLDAAERGGAHWWDAELHRIRAALRRATEPGSWIGVKNDLRKAIEIARTQDARLFELRAAADLARLMAERGEHQEARALLAPVLACFSDGLDTPDLIEAKACLMAAAG
jgi:hypothetical protein